MASVLYPAIIERGSDGFGVFFPDLPGCTSAGATIQEAAIAAEEALAGHLAVMDQHGDAVPPPSALDDLERDPEVDEAARVLIRAERPGRFIRVQISMDEGLVAAIDQVAGTGRRSRFLADAARRELAMRAGAAV